MVKTITMKPGETIVGLFRKLKKKNDQLNITGENVNYNAVRLEAYRQNREARLKGELAEKEIRFSTSITKKKGYVTIEYK